MSYRSSNRRSIYSRARSTPYLILRSVEREYWIALSMAAGIGPARFQRLLEVCGDAASAWNASQFELAAAGLERRTVDSLQRLHGHTPAAIAQRLEQLGIRAVTLLDDEYPANLRQIADAPPVLFVRGSLRPEDANAVALVGTRRATAYGVAVAEKLAHDLASAGVTVVSGLAKGIDTAAHRATVDAGGRTLAVLGNGLDQVYPAANRDLARRIVSSGALVSEFPPGTPPDAVNFPRRNRIIAGLARAIVIVEAGLPSGALITADFALEQGRDVLAVPGSILSPTCKGSNELLRQGATPVTCVEDILEVLGSPVGADRNVARGMPSLGHQETTVLDALGGDPRHVDELARLLGRSAGEVSATLALLELNGMARQVGGMLYTRA
jgi:DNA processing protein